MHKKVSLILLITLTITILFSVKSPASGAVKTNQPNSVVPSILRRKGRALVLTDYFPFNVDLTPNTGLHCGLEMGTLWYNVLAILPQ